MKERPRSQVLDMVRHRTLPQLTLPGRPPPASRGPSLFTTTSGSSPGVVVLRVVARAALRDRGQAPDEDTAIHTVSRLRRPGPGKRVEHSLESTFGDGVEDRENRLGPLIEAAIDG